MKRRGFRFGIASATFEGRYRQRRTVSCVRGFVPDTEAIYTMSIEYDLLPDLACAP